MTIYNSWDELNIDRNNAPGNLGKYDPEDKLNLKGDYSGNMTAAQCEDVVSNWKKKFYDVYGKAPVAFVFDDGWDAWNGKKTLLTLPVGKAVDIDKEITISMPKSSVFVFEGVDKGNFDFGEAKRKLYIVTVSLF